MSTRLPPPSLNPRPSPGAVVPQHLVVTMPGSTLLSSGCDLPQFALGEGLFPHSIGPEGCW